MTSESFLRKLLKHRGAFIALLFIVFLLLVAAFGELLPLPDPNLPDVAEMLSGPSREHLLGTDHLGRDILSRLVEATRVTLMAAAQGVGVAVLLGVPAGLLAGFSGGIIDALFSRVVEMLFSLPPLVLAFAIVGALGVGLTSAMVAVGVALSTRFFRVARGAARSASHEPYCEGARADGCSTFRILWRHVVPNSLSPLIVQVTFTIGVVIAAEGTLSYLGLGLQPPTSSWGTMIKHGSQTMRTDAFPLIPPSAALFLTSLAFFMLGDGLREVLGRGTREST